VRVLFAGLPIAGHLRPMVPLADAAAAAGCDIAFVSGASAARFLGGRPLLVAGPHVAGLSAECARRVAVERAAPGHEAVACFAGARTDSTFDPALACAQAFGPDVIVCEPFDYVGPMLAAALAINWVAHGISGPAPPRVWTAMIAQSAAEHRRRGLRPRPRLALVDPFPDALRTSHEVPDHDRIPIRPGQSIAVEDADPDPTAIQQRTRRPNVVVTLGSMDERSGAYASLIAAIASADFDVTVTHGEVDVAGRAAVEFVGFVPLAPHLRRADAVVTAGGTGTVLAALAHGKPMVLHPGVHDQHWNSRRVAAVGAGVAIDRPEQVRDALGRVLRDEAMHVRAGVLAAGLAALPSPRRVWLRLAAEIRPATA
jgi:UDP:flavonoid glycosyltransferase YjiC (YdhE family)